MQRRMPARWHCGEWFQAMQAGRSLIPVKQGGLSPAVCGAADSPL